MEHIDFKKGLIVATKKTNTFKSLHDHQAWDKYDNQLKGTATELLDEMFPLLRFTFFFL